MALRNRHGVMVSRGMEFCLMVNETASPIREVQNSVSVP
jgi:hypothetical protein